MGKDVMALSGSETKNWIKTLSGPAITKLSVFNSATLDRYEEDLPHMRSLVQEVRAKIEELNKLAEEIAGIDESVKVCRSFSLPFALDNKIGMSIFDYTSNSNTWEDYKNDLYKYWDRSSKERMLLPHGLSNAIYLVFRLAVPIICIVYGIVFKFNWLKSGFLGLLGAEIFADVVSWYYFMVRPNRINASILRKRRVDLYKKGRLLFVSIQTLNAQLEAEELLYMNPKEKLAMVKENKRGKLVNKLKDARRRAENINTIYKDSFIAMLDKCDEILKMAVVNGQIISSVQKIYEVYLGSILNILESGGNCSEDVELMLKSFNDLLDRQLERFGSDTQRAVTIDINAITASIKSDISDISSITGFGEELN